MAAKRNKKRKKNHLEEEPIHRNDSSMGMFSKLPLEVTVEILTRLPLKSLSQSKWVCKSWYVLITHPHFAKIHYHKAILNKKSPWVVIRSRESDYFLIDGQVLDYHQTSTMVYAFEIRKMKQFKPDTESYGERFPFQVVGAANGLICFASDPKKYHPLPYYILNPFTMEEVVLPDSPKNMISPIASAFGFDLSTGEHKIVRIWKNFSRFQAEIYTQGLGKWKKITDVPSIIEMRASNIFVSGCLHWLSREDGFISIVSFDLQMEKFGIIPLPTVGTNKVVILEVLGEKLSVFVASYDMEDIEVWVMENYGVHESWDRKYGVHESWANEYIFPWKSLAVNRGCHIAQLKNGEVVLLNNLCELGYYNFQNGTFTNILVHKSTGRAITLGYSLVMQVGSLLSPRSFVDSTKREARRKRLYRRWSYSSGTNCLELEEWFRSYKGL